ncbi:MAG: ABC transporter permease [Marinilabiliaceae bacterium]|nr:ABC transporter permease [Marinilabiliaceae bacterium]
MKNFKLFYRQFLKQKMTGFLSIGSLSLGITVAILTGLWCLNEFSFDTFHHQPENTYRVTLKGFINNESIALGSVNGPMGPEAKEIMPEVIEMTRFVPLEDALEVGSIKETAQNIYAVDSSFNKILNYEIKLGSIDQFTSNRNSIIINETWANRYYPGENPIGKIISFKGEREVAAVMYNVPINSHLNVEAMVRLDGLPRIANRTWGQNDNFITYLLVNDQTNIANLEEKITKLAHERFEPFKKMDIKFRLQPLLDIHLGDKYRFDYAITRNKNLVIAFGLMALIVLIIGSINFTNLFISNSFLRAKSIGVKKTNGAQKSNLILEFFTETFYYVCISTALSLLLVELALPMFSRIVGYDLIVDFTSPQLYLFLAILIPTTTLLAGAFPAFYMTHFNPVKTLKDQFTGNKVSFLQKSLLILQFAASIVLLISVITIKKQVSHIQNMDLGFSKENIIHLEMNSHMRKNYTRIAQELQACPEIIDVTCKSSTPLEWNRGTSVCLSETPNAECLMEICAVKANYFNMLNMPIVKGENPFGVSDSINYCMINEKAAETLGSKNPINKRIKILLSGTFVVKGVIKDAYTKSLHHDVDPQVYITLPASRSSVIMIKTSDHPQKAIETLSTIWRREVPERPFEYNFLDDDYAKLYHEEEIAGQVANWLMIIAFLITIAGLYGMARYAIKRRTKEIGLRKVNGATLGEIITLLNLSFVKWIALAFLLACPAAWYLMNRWLSDFAVRTEISWWVFVTTGLTALLVTLLTVSYQTYVAANQNPVKCLKYE